jgi:hypothetical protein
VSANTRWRETWFIPLVVGFGALGALLAAARTPILTAGWSLLLFATVVWALRTRPLPAKARPVVVLESVVLAAIATAAIWLALN